MVAPGVEVELVQEGYIFTEGPVGAPDGGLYFTDNRANKILLLDSSGKISVTHENTTNANGLVLTKEGDILAAEGVGKRISKRSKSGGAGVTLTDSFDGKPFMAPNDLFVDARGGIYFTDPGPRPVVPGRKTFVYYLAPGAKEPIVIDDQLGRPNGVILTADGKTLLVNDSLVEAFFAYDVEPSGAVKNKREFAKLRDIVAGQGKRRRRLCDRYRGPRLCRERARRAGVRCQGRLSRHHQDAEAVQQRGVCRPGPARAVHHRARGALSRQDAGSGGRSRRRQMSAHVFK